MSLLDQEENALGLDIENIRLGTRVNDSRLATQISINTTRGNVPDQSGLYTAGAIIGASGTIASGLSASRMFRVGGGGSSSSPVVTSSVSSTPRVTSSYNPKSTAYSYATRVK